MPRKTPADLLFILAIDHRVDFPRDLLGVDEGEPNAAQLERAAHLKGIVFAGLAEAVEAGLSKSEAGIWADTHMGEAVLLRSRGMSVVTVASVERPRAREFQFEDALGFAERLKSIDATYAGARVRYNPAGDPANNESHRHKLRRLSEICRSGGPNLLIELIVMPIDDQVKEVGGYAAWESEIRPVALVQTIQELQDAGVEPDLWVVDPPLDPTTAATVAAQAHVDDRTDTGMLFLVGGDQSITLQESGHDEIVRVAARTAGVTGLLIGPSTYYDSIARYNDGKIGREQATREVAANVGELVSLFTRARKTSEVS